MQAFFIPTFDALMFFGLSVLEVWLFLVFVSLQNPHNQPEAGVQKVKLCLWPALRVYFLSVSYSCRQIISFGLLYKLLTLDLFLYKYFCLICMKCSIKCCLLLWVFSSGIFSCQMQQIVVVRQLQHIRKINGFDHNY